MSLAETLLDFAPELADDVSELLHMIALSDSPKDAVTVAKAAIADAADIATDAALRKLLDK